MAANGIYVERDLPSDLHRIRMEVNSRFRRNLANRLDGLHNTSLVVRHHYGNQPGVRAQRFAHIMRIDQAIPVDGHECDWTPHLFETMRREEYGVVLDGRSNQVIAGLNHPKNREIVRLGTA